MKKLFLLLTLITYFSPSGWALPKELYAGSIDREDLLTTPSWEKFQRMMDEQKKDEQIEGMAYILSGGIAFVGGIVGYHNSKDVFAKGAYALAQSLGVAAVGYGAHQKILGNEHSVLYETLSGNRDLSLLEKDRFVKIYFQLERARDRESQKIAAITHGMLAGLNVYNGAITQQEDLRSALYFVAAINLLASLSYTF
jgi:hypothetical protein